MNGFTQWPRGISDCQCGAAYCVGDRTPPTKAQQIEAAWQQREKRYFHSRGFGLALKERLGEAQNWRCCYCGACMSMADATFEHVIPRALGGSDDETNLVIACKPCNLMRGSDMRKEHRMLIIDGLVDGVIP